MLSQSAYVCSAMFLDWPPNFAELSGYLPIISSWSCELTQKIEKPYGYVNSQTVYSILIHITSSSDKRMHVQFLKPSVSFQGVPAAGRVRYLLWRPVRKEDPVGDGVPLRLHQGPAVRREHAQPRRAPVLGSAPVCAAVVPRLRFHDVDRAQGRPCHPCEAALLIASLLQLMMVSYSPLQSEF